MSGPVLSLSTCWCSNRHQDGYAMVKEMIGLGFDHIELSHGIRITLVPGILKAVEEGIVKISSTHNFCPLPTGINHASPNLYLPSSKVRQESEQWFRHTVRSIEFTQQIGAPVMVLHLGKMEFFLWNPARRTDLTARAIFQNGGNPAEVPSFRRSMIRSLDKIRRKSEPFWGRVCSNLARIGETAKQCGVVLGCENRESLTELPMEEQFPSIFADLGGGTEFAYWHDTGHAQIKELLGVCRHRQLLERNRERIAGFHLHDVTTAGEDHRELGSGVVDFEILKDYIEPHHKLVIELSPRLSTDEVKRSRDKALELLQ